MGTQSNSSEFSVASDRLSLIIASNEYQNFFIFIVRHRYTSKHADIFEYEMTYMLK